jgi:hypothetical protein
MQHPFNVSCSAVGTWRKVWSETPLKAAAKFSHQFNLAPGDRLKARGRRGRVTHYEVGSRPRNLRILSRKW